MKTPVSPASRKSSKSSPCREPAARPRTVRAIRSASALGLVIGGALSFSAFLPRAGADEILRLDAYLGQVEGKHDGVKASRSLSQGAALRADEGRLLLAPQVFGRVDYSSDSRETVVPEFQGTKTETSDYRLGVRELTSFGLDASLSYLLTSTTVTGVSPAFVSQPSFYTASPVLDLSLSLWRNGFGSETRARQDLLEAQTLATHFTESYQIKTLRADAESAYWSLALARETVRVERESLARFEKMRELHRRKESQGLSDRADLLQASAAADSRRLDLQNAIDNEKAASRAFNSTRGSDAEEVPEALEPIAPEDIDRLRIPVRAELREDVKAAREQERVAVANALLGREAASPDLRVFATLTLNGRDPALSPTATESFALTHPYNSIGLEFSAPLDLAKVSRTREGYADTQAGSELRYQRALFDQERQWTDLVRRFSDAKGRLDIARSVQASQKEKVDYERGRLSKGRTTTFQVLTFEQDYANSQLAYIQAQATILQSIAQLKTFGGSP